MNFRAVGRIVAALAGVAAALGQAVPWNANPANPTNYSPHDAAQYWKGRVREASGVPTYGPTFPNLIPSNGSLPSMNSPGSSAFPPGMSGVPNQASPWNMQPITRHSGNLNMDPMARQAWQNLEQAVRNNLEADWRQQQQQMSHQQQIRNSFSNSHVPGNTSYVQPQMPQLQAQRQSDRQSMLQEQARQQQLQESFRHLFQNSAPAILLANRIKAARYTAGALPISLAAGEKLGQAITHATIAQGHLARGDADMALEHFTLAEASGDSSVRAQILHGKGTAYFAAGEMKQAIESYEEARFLMKASGDWSGEAEVLISLAWIYVSSGEAQRALKQYQDALALLPKEGDRALQKQVRLGMALLYHSLGQYPKAIEQLKIAILATDKLADRAMQFIVLGEVLQSQWRFDESVTFLEMAADMLREEGNKAGEAAALAALGRVHRLTGSSASLTRALQRYDRARQLVKEAGNRTAEAGIVANIGEVYFWFASAVLRTEAIVTDPRSIFFPKALALYEEALRMMVETGSVTGEIGVLTNIALLFDIWDKPKKAIEYYTRVIQMIEQLRTAARIEEFKTSVAQQSVDVYERAVLTHIKLNQHRQAFDLSERARARTFLDQLGSVRVASPLVATERRAKFRISALEAQLRDESAKAGPARDADVVRSLESHLAAARKEYAELLVQWKAANPEQAAILNVDPLNLVQIQQSLDRDTTLVSYFVTRLKTVAFVITRDSFRLLDLQAPEDRLNWAVAVLRDFSDLNQSPPALNDLYKRLVRPLRSHLKTSAIVIVPHHSLHNVPFAALTDGKSYLGDTFTISSLPTASAIQFLNRANEAVGETVLAMAPGPITGSAFLDNSVAEVKAVSAIFRTMILTGGAATKSALRDNLGKHDILHLATHYERNDSNPLFSQLALSPEADDAGSLNIHEVYDLDLRSTRMVVLSACSTQTGMQTGGDEIVALSRAFLVAGTPTVVASLWSVDDAATSELMRSFYSHLRLGAAKAEALRLAQKEIRRRYLHPYYWASFVLMGDRGRAIAETARISRAAH